MRLPLPMGPRDRPMRFNFQEASGALGDLGTFIPIVVSLVAVCHLDLGTILLFAGVYNIITGVLFKQPVPVQPMKAIAVVAIAETLSPGSIAAAGLLAGGVVFVLGLTGGVGLVERYIPRAVVRGIQLGVGLKLFLKGVSMVDATSWMSPDGWLVAAAAGTFVVVATRSERFPAALVLFAGGVLMMLITRPSSIAGLEVGWGGLAFSLPAAGEWRTGLLRCALPQIPLTLLNSVVAVCALSADLYPNRGIGTRPMAVSVGLMNLVGCWFGAMPMCHGSGGLAGQYRFGARTGGSVVMLGAAKIALGLLFGSSAALLMAAYPTSILGVLLCFAGAELALPARDCRSRTSFLVALITAAGCLAFNTALGVVIGMAVALLGIGAVLKRSNPAASS